jgi:hypothetical protein
MALVLLDPGLDGTACLPDVDYNALAGHAVHTRSTESQVILHRPKDVGDILGQQLVVAIESRAHVGQKGDRGRFLRWRCDSPQWVDSLSDLSIAVAILPESCP